MKNSKSEFVNLRITNAQKTLSEVDILIDNKLWNTAVNRIYYACFYAVCALLYNSDFDTKTHSGVKRLLSLHYIKTGLISNDIWDFYSLIFEMRQNADYEYMVDYEYDDVVQLLPQAKELIETISFILRLNP